MMGIHTINLFFSSMIRVPMRGYYTFREFNKKGIITLVAGAIIAISMVTYVGALFNIFQESFSFRRLIAEMEAIKEKVMILELELQKKQGDFAAIKFESTAEMEKISSIRYIGLESSTALLSK